MNFLIHAYCTFPDPEITWGNLYADSFKGSSYLKLPPKKAKGVLLHRKIDDFTDNHVYIKSLAHEISPLAGRMASPLTDVFFDFLFHQYAEEFKIDSNGVIDFAEKCLQNKPPSKGKMLRMLPFILRDNWLGNYAFEDAVISAFEGMAYRMNWDMDAEACFLSLYKAVDKYDAFEFIVQLKEVINRELK